VSAKIIRNFPQWLKDFLELGPERILMRIRRVLRRAQKARNQAGDGNLQQFEASDLIDFAAELPFHRQDLIASHYQAMKKYVPQPYSGTVTLFRAKSRPLFNTFDPETGWQKLAPGRVNVIDIPSSHEGMFKKPSVEELARVLKACLDGTQT
jgi:thioesterase domain-containing protein